jgi:hypothetical protein
MNDANYHARVHHTGYTEGSRLIPLLNTSTGDGAGVDDVGVVDAMDGGDGATGVTAMG